MSSDAIGAAIINRPALAVRAGGVTQFKVASANSCAKPEQIFAEEAMIESKFSGNVNRRWLTKGLGESDRVSE
jgi:hypothetical protein